MNIAQQITFDRSRGYFEPPGGVACLTDNGPTRDEEVLRILNQNAFFQDRAPTETYDQALNYLTDNAGSPTCLENAENQYTSSDIDPSLYTNLEREAVATGSNVFAHESQDFVAQVIKGVRSYQNEARLYDGDVTYTKPSEGFVQNTAEQNKVAGQDQPSTTTKAPRGFFSRFTSFGDGGGDGGGNYRDEL